MFDKLIESDSQGADFKNRSRYFMVSTMVVGILFATAVVFSLYAQEIGLGNQDFELAELLAPLATEAPVPPEAQPQQPRNQQTQSVRPMRQANIMQVAQSTLVPANISSVPNTQPERPDRAFDIGRYNLDLPNIGGTPNGNPPGTGNPIGTGSEPAVPTVTAVVIPVPPAIKPVVATPRTRSLGVVNGRASYLPKPMYPPAAAAVNIQGSVDVQVTISETGKVVSSKAINGHALLRGAAERAAWNAKFTPTRLSEVPVKVTGVIVYKFSRN